MIVLDASILIALLDEKDLHHSWALQTFIDTVSEDLAIAVLTLAEAMVHPVKVGRREEFLKNIEGLGLDVRGLEKEDVPAIAQVRASSGLKMSESIALHLAESSGAALATTDAPLCSVAMKRSVTVLHPF